jgi:hypothetical protein
MPFTRRAIAVALFALTLLPTFAQAAGAAGSSPASQEPNEGTVIIPGTPPPEEKPVLDAIAANDERRTRVIRRAGLAGVAAGILLAAAGFAVMYREAGSDPDVPTIHSGIGLVLSGALISALSSSAARYPREGRTVNEKE